MNTKRSSNWAQSIAAAEDNHRLRRIFAGILALVALGALFVYRAATCDPLWDTTKTAQKPPALNTASALN